jgi:hypothetical protein
MNIILFGLSVISLLGFPIAVGLYRIAAMPFMLSAQVIMATLGLAVVVIILATISAIRNRKKAPKKSAIARRSAFISLVPIVFILASILPSRDLPQIHNISTDINNPPAFNAITHIRTSNDNPLDYDAATLAPLQQAAYPEVKTLMVSDSPSDAFERALVIANGEGWLVVDHDKVEGRIEATATSRLWGFKDDVVIRIQPQLGGSGSIIDLRSVSRVGRSDLGKNAERIIKFINAYR